MKVVLLDCLTFTAQLYDNDESIIRVKSYVFFRQVGH